MWIRAMSDMLDGHVSGLSGRWAQPTSIIHGQERRNTGPCVLSRAVKAA